MTEKGNAIKTMPDTRNLTLLVITPDFPDEEERYIGSIYVKNQIEALRLKFQKIVVVCPVLFSFQILPNDRYCSNYQYENVSVYYPRSFFIPRSLSLPLVSNKQKLLFDLRYYAVNNLIQKEKIKFDLIHAHFTWPSAAIAVRLKEKYHVPVVVTIHEDSGWLREEIAMNDPRIWQTWKKSDALIRVNKNELSEFLKYNNVVYAVPNGFSSEFIPLDMDACRRELGLPQGKKILFTFGDIVERKGFQHLIDAMKILSGRREDLLCIISGRGSYRSTLSHQIERLGLEDIVHLKEFIPTEKIPLWINSADLFVFPSLIESFGIVQIEALACGKPVIAARNAGSLDVITSDDVGILCEPGSSAALAEALSCGLVRTWDPAKIIKYVQKFRWETIADELNDIYKNVLEDQSNITIEKTDP